MERAFFFTPKVLSAVIPRDESTVVNPDASADHAEHERRFEADLRAEEPAGVPANRRTKERKELTHTGKTISRRRSAPLRHSTILGINLGARPRRQEKVDQPGERERPPQTGRHHAHLSVAGEEYQGE